MINLEFLVFSLDAISRGKSALRLQPLCLCGLTIMERRVLRFREKYTENCNLNFYALFVAGVTGLYAVFPFDCFVSPAWKTLWKC